MNRAIWLKMFRDGWLQLAVSSILLVLFAWCFVWLMSLFDPGAMAAILNLLPKFVEPMLGVPLGKLASTAGRISVLYAHVVTLLICLGWALSRGSDLVSGEINRGTMDLLATLPVRRYTIVFASAVVTGLGAAELALSVWAGSWVGMKTVKLPGPITAGEFLPGVINLASMTFCLAGLTALASSLDRSRWRTIMVAGGFFVVSSVVKLIARLWTPGAWLGYLSCLSAFEPQKLVLLAPEVTRSMAWRYNGTLLGLGLAGYCAAALVFSRRDIPAAY